MKNKKDSDYELLYLISENNEDAKKLFYEKYKPIIEMKVKKYISYVESRGYDYNDLVQEGKIGYPEQSLIISLKKMYNLIHLLMYV